MLVEHTYSHKKQTRQGAGEFIELTMLVGVDDAAVPDRFENWSTDRRLRQDLLKLIEKGALAAVQTRGLKGHSIVVALIDYRWLEADTPDWLFKQGAKACVEEALLALENQS
ncbi:MAG: hypothetical protein ACU0BK_09770 [Shimia sp.]|uniref:hypothetical protein n=1 Tax=Shimia sp. TaxID=1954381 RepID=UPI004059D851